MKRFLAVASALVLAGALSLTACKKAGVVEETDETPAPPQTGLSVPDSMPAGTDAPAPIERRILDDEVSTRWRGVEITVTEKVEEGEEAGQSFVVELPLDGEVAVEGTPFTLRSVGFVPDFAMGGDAISTNSLDDNNPAVRIVIIEEGEEVFEGWSFRDFPGMHAFEDARYAIQMTAALPVE